MKYGSVCSGIEAASVAWHNLGWEPQWFSEIEQFPSDVLKHRFPTVPNLGDMTTINQNPIADERPIDLLVGGTPCQSFSVAGLRKGLADPRGNLMLTFLSIADKLRPKWIVWENVPGVLSSNGGKDFGTFLGALGELGYGFAFRTLNAEYFGVAQRRRRVFVVGYLGDWRVAAAVLFERESLQGNTKP
ncbi:MAG: DNA cytosine methyltransferase, partial [Proteobacteria bacterium]|nr:DNA cytosine methyltransferase [Pseudomonadota bacterium]